MKVVDTNVLLYFYVPGDHTAAADALFKSDSEWIAPYLWRSEFRNILALYVRQSILHDTQALKISAEAESFMDGREFMVSSQTVLNLAFSSKLSAYDCEFVALAKQVNTPLITMDQKLLTLFPADVLSLASFKTHS